METLEHRPPLLFVHGAWHGGWCWEDHFLPWFSVRDWDCTAVTLRGYGDGTSAGALRWQPAVSSLDDVWAAIERMPRPPVLIGHSLGGYLVMKALERRALPGAVLLAPVPITGALPAFLRALRSEPRALLGAALALDAGRIVATPHLVRRFLFTPAVPEVTIRRAYDRVSAQSLRAILDAALNLPRAAAIGAHGTPLLLVAGAQDGLFTQAEQQHTARALGASFLSIDHAGHDLMLDPRWEAAASAIDDWLQVNIRGSSVKVS